MIEDAKQKYANSPTKLEEKIVKIKIEQLLGLSLIHILYSIITHSTAIEGSTVTETENQLLFDEGLDRKSVV